MDRPHSINLGSRGVSMTLACAAAIAFPTLSASQDTSPDASGLIAAVVDSPAPAGDRESTPIRLPADWVTTLDAGEPVVKPLDPAIAHFSMIEQPAAPVPMTDPTRQPAERRGEAVDPRIAELKRPMRELRVSADYAEGVTPDNRALVGQEASSPIYLTAGMNPVPTFDRYPYPFVHLPLFFEERNLERCGRGYGFFQNAVSSYRLVAGTLVLPCRLATQNPHQCVTSPGDCRTCEVFREPTAHLPHAR